MHMAGENTSVSVYNMSQKMFYTTVERSYYISQIGATLTENDHIL